MTDQQFRENLKSVMAILAAIDKLYNPKEKAYRVRGNAVDQMVEAAANKLTETNMEGRGNGNGHLL